MVGCAANEWFSNDRRAHDFKHIYPDVFGRRWSSVVIRHGRCGGAATDATKTRRVDHRQPNDGGLQRIVNTLVVQHECHGLRSQRRMVGHAIDNRFVAAYGAKKLGYLYAHLYRRRRKYEPIRDN